MSTFTKTTEGKPLSLSTAPVGYDCAFSTDDSRASACNCSDDDAPDAVDLVVVGSGMFGPWNQPRGSSDFFSSHDDVSRLYRHQVGASSSSDPSTDAPLHPSDLEHMSSGQFWSEVSSASIRRFDDIASESSISFHYPVGFLALGHSSSPYMKGLLESAATSSSPDPVVTYDSLGSFHATFPYVLSSSQDQSPVAPIPPSSFAAVHMRNDAGYLNPNKLIAAQRQIFEDLGGLTVDSVLCTSIEQRSCHVLVHYRPVGEGAAAGAADSQRTIKCRRALLAAGAFSQTVAVTSDAATGGGGEGERKDASSSIELFPKTQVIALFEISKVDVETKLKGMPTMVYAGPTKGLKGTGANGEDVSLEQEHDSAYLLPPIFYEDEQKWYLKIGHGKKLELDLPATSLDSLSSWYEEPSALTAAEVLTWLFRRLFPSIDYLSVKFVNAGLTADTRDGKPAIYMGREGLDRVGFCTGGNGYGAKACDEIGRLAAELFKN